MFHICAQCNALFTPVNKRGRASQFCGGTCQNRYYYERRVRESALRCASCNNPMSITKTSAPNGRARCLPCRREARGLAATELYRDAVAAGLLRKNRAPCVRCGGIVDPPPGSRRWKYCSDECFEQTRKAKGHGFSRAKASPEARGYGPEHRALREKLLPLAYGNDCFLCGDVMEEGQKLHLDHNEDRTGYRGMVHGICNLRDGARRGRERQRQRVLAEGWRHGSSSGPRRRTADTAA